MQEMKILDRAPRKGKGDGYSKGDEKVAKSDLPHVSVGLPGDGITRQRRWQGG